MFKRIGIHYKHHFLDISRERLFLSSVSFFVTFAIIRAITHSIRAGVGPFHNMNAGGRHIHHLVWGILVLLVVGYFWLLRVGSGEDKKSRAMSRLTAMLYGIGAALTLDEFALLLNLRDVYWEREGRESIDAVILFGAILSIGLWARRFFHALFRDFVQLFKRH